MFGSSAVSKGEGAQRLRVTLPLGNYDMTEVEPVRYEICGGHETVRLRFTEVIAYRNSGVLIIEGSFP
jgi:hypothetical protein